MQVNNTRTRIWQPVLAPPKLNNFVSEDAVRILNYICEEWNSTATCVAPSEFNKLQIDSVSNLTKRGPFDEFTSGNEQLSIQPIRRTYEIEIPETIEAATLTKQQRCVQNCSGTSLNVPKNLEDWVDESVFTPIYNSDTDDSPPFEPLSPFISTNSTPCDAQKDYEKLQNSMRYEFENDPVKIQNNISVNNVNNSINKMDFMLNNKYPDDVINNNSMLPTLQMYFKPKKNKMKNKRIQLHSKASKFAVDGGCTKNRNGYVLQVSKKTEEVPKTRQIKITEILKITSKESKNYISLENGAIDKVNLKNNNPTDVNMSTNDQFCVENNPKCHQNKTIENNKQKKQNPLVLEQFRRSSSVNINKIRRYINDDMYKNGPDDISKDKEKIQNHRHIITNNNNNTISNKTKDNLNGNCTTTKTLITDYYQEKNV